MKTVLNQSVKMVNYVRQRPLNHVFLENFASQWNYVHISLILYTEVRWLSRGNVLSSIYELREELLIFFH